MRGRTVVLISVCFVSFRPAPVALPVATPNDNRTPAGVASDGGVLIELDARRVMWYSDGDSLPGRLTEAFAERGKTPVVPGPLLRVRVGTRVSIRMRNAEFPDTLRLIVGERHAPDTLVVPPGGDGVVHYTPTKPGNFYYRAITSDVQSNFFNMKGLLGGAFIVDSATAPPPSDRVLVVNWLVDSLTPDKSEPNFNRLVFAINGRSWPHTERLSATVGDTIRWRVINLNQDPHPFHLHGVYFRVDDFSAAPAALAAKGPPGRMAVTELMPAFSTMSISWVPERAGNWLFHCHFALHLIPQRIFQKGEAVMLQSLRDESHSHHENHAQSGMAGLVMGVIVAPRPGTAVADADEPRRRLRLVAVADSGFADTVPSLRFRLEEPATGTRTDAHLGFSPSIVLTRGEPVSIMVVNSMSEPTAVHWHGMELESYYDGAAGFGGIGTRISPIIAPRDSFEARFTPPRSGTFMYHSHVNEVRQHAAGLVGPLIVRDGTGALDNDHTIFIKAPRSNPGALPLEINGQPNPDTIVFRANTPVRLRFISLAAFNPNATVWLTARSDSVFTNIPDSLVATWRPIAKDGADLPAMARTPRLARQVVSMGEAYDFEFTPTRSGPMQIEVRAAGAEGILLARVPVRVR